jgi:hypothetical protein
MILVAGSGGGKGVRIDVGVSLLVIVALEASLLGGGRMIQFGPLTLKMWLFLAAQLYVFFQLLGHERLKVSSMVILLLLTVVLCIGTIIGVLHNSTQNLIFQDISPMLYCFMLFFFEAVIRTEKHLRLIVRIIEFSSLLMSFVLITAIALFYLGVINFYTLYGWFQTSDGEIVFRGDSGLFTFSGALYIGVGLIFFAFERNRLAKLAVVVTIVGLAVTGTRGFILAMAGVLLVHILTGVISLRKKLIYVGLACVCLILTGIMSSTGIVSSTATSGKAEGDSMRVQSLQQIEERITPWSFVFGNGLGVGVPLRPNHMEMAYAEIFHKQGLLGLMWWGTILVLLIMRYRKARYISYLQAQPLLLSVVFVIVTSATNSYVDNPIGIFVWLAALVGLDVVSEEHPQAMLLAQRKLAVS